MLTEVGDQPDDPRSRIVGVLNQFLDDPDAFGIVMNEFADLAGQAREAAKRLSCPAGLGLAGMRRPPQPPPEMRSRLSAA